MHESSYPDFADLPYLQQVEIDDACDRFERALRAGEAPDPQELVRLASDGSRVPLLLELMAVEHHHRGGDLRAIQTEYAPKFPEYRPAIEALTTQHMHDLQPGSQLGSFRIERKIGAGGMGVVYEAHDTKLERNVALKLLPAEFALNQPRLDRFRLEAKILAGLNHPNIATLFGLEEQEGCHYLVLEYVPGHTLGEILSRGRMPLHDAMDTFLQIAEALEYAHESGVIHRDLKPANVKLLPNGAVKVLDFGLATSFPVFSRADEIELPCTSPLSTTSSLNLPASTRPAEEISRTTGIFGTLPYMSPEQASRKPVDKRSDIWAFGCCLYESLTGQRAFPEATPEQVLKAIAEREADWTFLPRELPASLERLLRRCLTKDARQRLRDIGDARIELRDCQAGASSATRRSANKDNRPQRAFLIRTLSTALLTAIVTGVAVFGLLRPKADIKEAAEVRVTVPLPLGVELDNRPGLAFSPNGSYLAYVAVAQDGKSHLYVRRIDEFHSKRLEGTEDAEQPFFSPEGLTVGFFADHQLRSVSVLGGQPKLVCNAGHPMGGCWTADNQIIFGWDFGGALDSISPDGSDRRNLARVGEAYYYCWPELLPDRKTLVFGLGRVMMADLDELAKTPANRTDAAWHPVLIRRGGFARYVNGHLLYGHRGTLHAVPFGLDPPRVTGSTKTVVDDLWTESRGSAQFAVSDRDVAYVAGEAMEEGQLVWKSRRTDDPPEPAWPGYRVYESFRLSPDGKRLAIGVLGAEGYDIWIYDFETKTASNLDSEGENQRPIWSPDGKTIIFLSDRNDQRGLYSKEVGTNKPPKLLVASPYRQTPVCLRQDEKKLIFYRTSPGSSDDILELDLDNLTTRPLVATDRNEAFGVLSADGEWMAYTATGATPDYQVFVGRYPPSTEPPTRISSQTGGLDPMWSPVDENEIFFRDTQISSTLFSVKVARDPFRIVKTVPILAGPYMDVPGFSFDYDPSTNRFLLIQSRGYDA